MKKPIAIRLEVIASLIKNELNLQESAHLLGCTKRTISTYLKNYLIYGYDGLKDHRHSNYHRLTPEQVKAALGLKMKDCWRFPRNVGDKLSLPVHHSTVWRVFKEIDLPWDNVKRVKAITRFEAEKPNDIWQTDIMGKITFGVGQYRSR
jgi:transposase